MANTFKNYTSESIGTSETTVYTVPASTTAVTIGCNIANRTTSTINVDVKLGTTFVVKGAPIPANSALSVLTVRSSLRLPTPLRLQATQHQVLTLS